MKDNEKKFVLASFDEIFSTQESRDDAKREKVMDIPLSELHPFKGHPFKVKDDEKMMETVESVRQRGVLVPAIARPDPKGGYELISGHRRHRASQLAGAETLPVIVRDLDDDEATIIMVDSNLQRETLLPSERAFAYKMKLEAVKHQGARTDLTSRQVVGKLEMAAVVGEQAGDSGRQVQRYIRLTELIPQLLCMVDEKKIAFNPAYELSFLKAEEQEQLLDAMESEQSTPSLSQAQRLKKFSQEGRCTPEVMEKHRVAPSFSSVSNSGAKVQTMRYNPQTGKYSVTLTDTNNTGCDLKFSATSGISVSRNGNQYTFSTSQTITNPVTLTTQKKIPQDTGTFLVWSNGQDQTLATGVEDPVRFYIKLQTEPVGEVKITKQTTDHTGRVVKLSGAVFDLMVKDGNRWTKATTLVESKTGEYTLPTNTQGYYSYTLQVGKTYKVVETAAPSGVVNTGWESQKFTYAAGGKYSYTCNNEIPTGGIKLEKTDELAGFPLEGAVFEVTAAQDITYTLNGSTYTRFRKGDVVGQMTTDASGVASLSGLYYGTYTVTEIQAPDGYHILIPAFTVTVAAPANYQSTIVYPSAAIGVSTYDGVTSTPDGGTQLTNRPMLANLTIHKSGQGDKDMSGVKLQLVDAQGNVVAWSQQEDGSYAAMLVQDGQWVPAQGVDTVITDAQGRVELVNIPYSTYTLREIQTEAGYQLLPNPVTITLPYEVAGEKDPDGGEVYYSNGTNYYYHLTYDLRNTLVYRLPATGGYAAWLIGGGIALAALCLTGLAMHKRTKHNEEENK